jgi:hypothetical protein
VRSGTATATVCNKNQTKTNRNNKKRKFKKTGASDHAEVVDHGPATAAPRGQLAWQQAGRGVLPQTQWVTESKNNAVVGRILCIITLQQQHGICVAQALGHPDLVRDAVLVRRAQQRQGRGARSPPLQGFEPLLVVLVLITHVKTTYDKVVHNGAQQLCAFSYGYYFSLFFFFYCLFFCSVERQKQHQKTNQLEAQRIQRLKGCFAHLNYDGIWQDVTSYVDA